MKKNGKIVCISNEVTKKWLEMEKNGKNEEKMKK